MNKVCVITGASGDIGYSISEKFAKEGYDLVLCYNNNLKRTEELKKSLYEKYNTKIITVKVDISLEESIKQMISTILKDFKRIDVLINNAAVEISSDINDKNKDSFRKALDVNVIGTFLVTKYIGEIMLKQNSGKIVNISSNNGINKYDPNTLEYDVSKSAINNMTKSLAIYYAPYINVNAVAPGWVKTDKIIRLDKELNNKFISSESEKILLKRFATPDEISELVYFLSSNKSNYITGEVIKIDGGTNE